MAIRNAGFGDKLEVTADNKIHSQIVGSRLNNNHKNI